MATETGKIVGGFGQLYDVLTDRGERIKCSVRGILKHRDIIPLVGDNVAYEKCEKGKDVITEVFPRKNSLIRPPVANIDRLFIVTATRSPEPIFDMLNKITCAAYSKGIEPILVINKTDLASPDGIYEMFGKSGIKIIEVCAKSGKGIDKIKAEICGVCAFAGASGVGKSSLTNALFPDLKVNTGDVSEKNSHGRHTTKTVELFKVENGFLADTPGFGLIDFERFDFVSVDMLPASFPEFVKYLGKCRYTDCTHIGEDGCAILSAVESGEISALRHKCYAELYSVLKNKKSYK